MSNHITNVAIVGAGGNSGSRMTQELLKTGKHTVTAITRHESDSSKNFPKDVIVRKVDYTKPQTIVEALRGQEALIITLSGRSDIHAIEAMLVRAAADAGVPWILPNEWSPDSAHEGILKDVSIFSAKVKTRQLIEELGKSSYVSVSTGFWYEWMLPNAAAFGFDFAKHEVVFFDDGNTPVSFSTWPQVGRAVAGILSLPIKAEGTDKSACLEAIRNKVVYVNSFTVSQKDMLESAQRVTYTTSEDWTVSKEASQQRYDDGVAQFKKGEFMGMMKMMSTRIFFLDECGDFEHKKGTINAMLGLQKEDLDEYTAIAIERAKNPAW
ncbi:hypothetical protein AMS68_004756 [Peltaster fructicola]|uniref:NmrA-like domain-containing protein n=1 Tax=Peltaster fructicola TaxID=286661 RepID=A0A6H0XX92_9PEZI|nr:hypothetical protein AMS68_004756 [Peltaster fructicola]